MSAGSAQPRLIAHYELLDELGRGGMGAVYRARDTRLDRIVALKVMAGTALQSVNGRARFEREAKMLAKLSHPNVATIHDAGVDGSTPYLVCEYLAGGTLSERLSGSILDVREICRLGAQISDGLAAVHAHGMVHRDLKPQNVLFTEAGVPKLVDFGLSRLTGTTEITADGTTVGTYGFTAPEQLRGEQADARSDIFSLGVLLYFLASGRRPFQATSVAELVQQVLTFQPTDLRTFRTELPEALVRVIEQCLEKDPERRPASAALVADALRVLASPTVSEATLTMVGNLPRFGRPRVRKWIPAVLAVVLVGTAGFATPRLKDWWALHFGPKHVAILPLESPDQAPERVALSEGLSESLVDAITQVQQFQDRFWIVPLGEVRAAKVRTVRDARRAFNVTLVLQGTLRRAGGMEELVLTLADARDLRVLGSRIVRTGDSRLRAEAQSAVFDLLRLHLDDRALNAAQSGGSSNSQANRAYLEGSGYLKNGFAAKAIPALERAVAQDASFVLARASLAEAYARQYSESGDSTLLARADREVSLVGAHDLIPVRLAVGIVHQATGRHDEAIAAFERVLGIDPRNPDGLRLLGGVYESLGKMSEAEAMFRRAIVAHPGYWPSHAMHAAFYSRQGHYERALEPLRLVTELAPENPLGFRNFGVGYYRLKRYDEAIEFLNRSIAMMPTPQALSDLGTIYFFKGQYSDAAKMYEKAIALAPSAYRWGNLGDARERLAQEQGAREAYLQAISMAENQALLVPRDAELRSSIAVYYAKTHQNKEAVHNIEAALEITRKNVNVLYKAARVYSLVGDKAKAVQYLVLALNNGYSKAEARNDPDLGSIRRWHEVSRLLED